MDWKSWKFGLFVAILTGFMTAFAIGGIVDSMTWKQFWLVVIGSIAKDALLYLKSHPADSVKFEQTVLTTSADGATSSSKVTVTQPPVTEPPKTL